MDAATAASAAPVTSSEDLTAPVRGGPLARAAFRWMGFGNNILLIPLFTVMVAETSTGNTSGGVEYATANLFFCGCFIAEYALGLALARSRVAYLRLSTTCRSEKADCVRWQTASVS